MDMRWNWYYFSACVYCILTRFLPMFNTTFNSGKVNHSHALSGWLWLQNSEEDNEKSVAFTTLFLAELEKLTPFCGELNQPPLIRRCRFWPLHFAKLPEFTPAEEVWLTRAGTGPEIPGYQHTKKRTLQKQRSFWVYATKKMPVRGRSSNPQKAHSKPKRCERVYKRTA